MLALTYFVRLTAFSCFALFASVSSAVVSTIDLAKIDSDRTVLIRVHTPGDVSTGTGAWLKPGKVITASHLFRHVRREDDFKVEVIWRGVEFQADIDRIENPESIDVAVLQVRLNETEGMLHLRALHLCDKPLQVAQPVAIGIRSDGGLGTTLLSFGSPDRVEYVSGEASSSAVTVYLEPGDSGAPVYDARSGCLLGIVSYTDGQLSMFGGRKVYATAIVPIEKIRRLLGHDWVPPSS